MIWTYTAYTVDPAAQLDRPLQFSPTDKVPATTPVGAVLPLISNVPNATPLEVRIPHCEYWLFKGIAQSGRFAITVF